MTAVRARGHPAQVVAVDEPRDPRAVDLLVRHLQQTTDDLLELEALGP